MKGRLLGHSSQRNLSLTIAQQHRAFPLNINTPHLITRRSGIVEEHIAVRSCDEVREMEILNSLRIRTDFEFQLVRFLGG